MSIAPLAEGTRGPGFRSPEGRQNEGALWCGACHVQRLCRRRPSSTRRRPRLLERAMRREARPTHARGRQPATWVRAHRRQSRWQTSMPMSSQPGAPSSTPAARIQGVVPSPTGPSKGGSSPVDRSPGCVPAVPRQADLPGSSRPRRARRRPFGPRVSPDGPRRERTARHLDRPPNRQEQTGYAAPLSVFSSWDNSPRQPSSRSFAPSDRSKKTACSVKRRRVPPSAGNSSTVASEADMR